MSGEFLKASQVVRTHINGATGSLLKDAFNLKNLKTETITEDGRDGSLRYSDLTDDHILIPHPDGDYVQPFSEVQSAERKTGKGRNGADIAFYTFVFKDGVKLETITDSKHSFTITNEQDRAHYTYGEEAGIKQPPITIIREGTANEIFIEIDGDKKLYKDGFAIDPNAPTTPAAAAPAAANAQVKQSRAEVLGVTMPILSVAAKSTAEMAGMSKAGRMAKSEGRIDGSYTWKKKMEPHHSDFKEYEGISNTIRDVAYNAADVFANSYWLTAPASIGASIATYGAWGAAAGTVGAALLPTTTVLAGLLAAGAVASVGLKAFRTMFDADIDVKDQVASSQSEALGLGPVMKKAFTIEEAMMNNFGTEITVAKVAGKVAGVAAIASGVAVIAGGIVATIGIVPAVLVGGTAGALGLGAFMLDRVVQQAAKFNTSVNSRS